MFREIEASLELRGIEGSEKLIFRVLIDLFESGFWRVFFIEESG